jgi:hypothetical protein
VAGEAKIVLAATWHPRGEMPRLVRLLPQLRQAYRDIVISLQLETTTAFARSLSEGLGVRAIYPPEWEWGRYIALRQALELDTDYVHYADLDRLLRWVEIRPDEWMNALQMIQTCDYLIIGRTQHAFRTHPQALQQTEAISNRVVSHLIGQPVDVSAGSKGFKRAAGESVVQYSVPGHAIGTDGEWSVLLHRAGFEIGYLAVDGLDWESADRYQEQAADPDHQRKQAELYDMDPVHWARRVEIALEIVQWSLQTSKRDIPRGYSKM